MLIILLAGVVSCGVLLQILAPDHDNAFHLEIAARMLAGGRYFFDFMELNPPLYPVLMIPVHGLRALTGLDLYSGFHHLDIGRNRREFHRRLESVAAISR